MNYYYPGRYLLFYLCDTPAITRCNLRYAHVMPTNGNSSEMVSGGCSYDVVEYYEHRGNEVRNVIKSGRVEKWRQYFPMTIVVRGK